MKKKFQYNFKFKFSADGEVLNTHCECPGGKVSLHIVSSLLNQFIMIYILGFGANMGGLSDSLNLVN